MAAVWIILAKTRVPAELIESSIQHGVQTVSIPFQLSADFLPDLLRRPDAELTRLTAGLPPAAPAFDAIIHQSPVMQRVVARARRVAPRRIPVLIEGESGTGKELFARAIHRAGPRSERPMITVNCGAIAPELIESELFGHEKVDTTKYAIDSYQREYAWRERQVRELIDDLTGRFLDSYEDGHARHEVERYGHYFLGSVVLSHKRGDWYVVDGQQRLTTLTLFLIYLKSLQALRDDQVPVDNLIYSEMYGRKSFNLDIADRNEVMQALLEGRSFEPNGCNESVRNIVLRYDNIRDSALERRPDTPTLQRL